MKLNRRFLLGIYTVCGLAVALGTAAGKAKADWVEGDLEVVSVTPDGFEYGSATGSTPEGGVHTVSVALQTGTVTMAVAYGHTHAWASVTPPSSSSYGFDNYSVWEVGVTARRVCTWDTYGPPSQISWNDTWIWDQSATGGNPNPMGYTSVGIGNTDLYGSAGVIFNTDSASTSNLTFTLSGSLTTRYSAGSLGADITYKEDEEANAIRVFYL